LRVAPNTELNVCDPAPNSGVFVLPRVIAPAPRMRDEQGVFRRHVIAKERRAVRRADASGLDEVLVSDPKPVEDSSRARLRRGLVETHGVGHRAFGDQ
jgi:hypothetical protein